MPLYKILQPNTETVLKIWEITEPLEELMQSVLLKPESLDRVYSMKSELHQRAFVCVRHILREFGYTDTDLYYDEFGKPYLKDGKHISISHSYHYAGVIVSENRVGLDIEKQREKISKIAHKFLGYESSYLKKEDEVYVKKLTVIWCIKESLYKLFAKQGLSFKRHTLVIPFTLKDETTIAWIDYNIEKHKFKTNYFEFNGFSCAYALPD